MCKKKKKIAYKQNSHIAAFKELVMVLISSINKHSLKLFRYEYEQDLCAKYFGRVCINQTGYGVRTTW